MTDLGFLGDWANKVIEPYRGLPFGANLHTTPRRQRTLTGPLDDSQKSIWQKLQVFSAVEAGQHTAGQEQCGFLAKLPLEIRLLIYDLVLGGMVFHIQAKNTNDPHCRLLSWVCRRPDMIYDDDSLDAHVPCFAHDPSREGRPSSAPREDYPDATGFLPLLVSCRRIYSEAIHVLYSSNTFEFTQNRPAFRFLKVMIPATRLKDIRRFKWDVRLPYHPCRSARALKDWHDLFGFFTNETANLRHLHLKLQPLHPMQADIQRTRDDSPPAADWIRPMITMSIDANRQRACEVMIVSNHVRLEPEAIFRKVAEENPDESHSKVLDLACAEMHRRIRLSLEQNE